MSLRDDLQNLNDLQNWYAAQCDEDWEHSYGISIATLDNPGWSVTIDLTDTLLEDKAFKTILLDQETDRWMECKVEEKTFRGMGAPHRLSEILKVFLDWAKTEADWLAIPDIDEETLQAQEDKAFWASLGEEAGPERCRRSGCTRNRIGLSVLCRLHHFEAVKGRAFSGANDL